MSAKVESVPGGKRPKRRPYQAPRLSQVDLKAEEVLGLGCKAVAGAGFGETIAGCLVRPCSASGS